MNVVYDEIARQYKTAKHQTWRRCVESYTLFELLGNVDGRRVLDLACGEGYYSRQLRQRGAHVVGIDVSASMIRLARDEESWQPLGIEYRVGDATCLPPTGSFDLVLAAYLFCNARNETQLQAMARSIAGNLRPGGRLVAVTDNPAQPIDSFAAQRKYGFEKSVAGALVEGAPITCTIFLDDEAIRLQNYYLPIAAYERALRKAGLVDIRWHAPRLSLEGRRAAQPGYWDDFMNRPPIVFIEATKQLS
jgi:toxoflavin synthase